MVSKKSTDNTKYESGYGFDDLAIVKIILAML